MKKTILFLSAVIIFSLFPFSVFAGEIITHKAEISEYPGSVTLRAYVPVSDDNTNRRVSFEWGEGRDMPFNTEARNVSPYFPSTSNYSYRLSRLKPNTTYYYRLLVEESDGYVWRGPTQSFVTVGRDFYDYNSDPVIGFSDSKKSSTKNTQNTVEGNALSGGVRPSDESSFVSGSSGQGTSKTGQENDLTGTDNAKKGFWASLFGSANSSNSSSDEIALASQAEQETSGSNSFYQNAISFAKWAVLALVIFLTTALFVYTASLYERVKETKKKNKEEEKLPSAPANLPR